MNAIIISELPCSSWAKNHAANNRVRPSEERGNLRRLPAASSEGCVCPHSCVRGDWGPRRRDLGARDEQNRSSFWK